MSCQASKPPAKSSLTSKAAAPQQWHFLTTTQDNAGLQVVFCTCGCVPEATEWSTVECKLYVVIVLAVCLHVL